MSELRVLLAEQPNAVPVMRLADRPLLQSGSALISVLACALEVQDAIRLAGGAANTMWPLVAGRYFVGAVDALGAGLTEDASGQRLRVGTPVLVPSVAPCGQCQRCRQPLAFAPPCLTPRRLGVGAMAGEAALLSGGLAEAVHVTDGPIHALPLTMPPWIATLAEPFAACLLACARAQAIGRLPPGASVVVIGRDASALLAVIAALELGAGRVVVLGGPDLPFLRLARQCGAEATIDADEIADPDEQAAVIRETLGGIGADLVLSTLGVPAEGLGCLRDGGTLVAMGAGPSAPGAIVERHLMVLGVSGFLPADIPVALGLLYRARGRYPLAGLHARFPFTASGVAEALGALRSGATPRALIVHRPDLA